MAVNNVVYVNECGLPLNAIEWLETHHRCKAPEREAMICDLNLKPGNLVIDAGCGPGLWTPLLARSIGSGGYIISIDISPEALVTAQQRSTGTWYHRQVRYKQATMEELPVPHCTVDTIFSANVSQYLSRPVETFAAMGRYLVPGGMLAIKDIDFGTMHFQTVDPILRERVFRARQNWEQQRIHYGFSFEDSWVGSKLAGYLRAAGYKDVQEKTYRIVRTYPLNRDCQAYIQGIARWFVCEDAPFLANEYIDQWLQCFFDENECPVNQSEFAYEETEYLVTGIWNAGTTHYSLAMQSKPSSSSTDALLPTP